ncbi:hypothetical protein [Macrococcus armenti]|uniref:Uncharacterized protein n=1 Tax=Macrococcus armenti TaxID=2875764 RepID=A0ABY3ZY78_9STAP|nr:hypothetical protein [Macrococcus armenti]UOB20909.1 hypothetical protein MRZ06_02175 [Macrococcus armenti]
MAKLYNLVIEKEEVIKSPPRSVESKKITYQMNKIINKSLEDIVKCYDQVSRNKYHYVYVVQNLNDMLTVVGKSSFKTCNNQKQINNKAQGDLFDDISHWNKKFNSIGKLKGTQHIEVSKYCIKMSNLNYGSDELDAFFRENRGDIKKYLRRLYKNAWIIPINGDNSTAKKVERLLGNFLLNEKKCFISNKYSHIS